MHVVLVEDCDRFTGRASETGLARFSGGLFAVCAGSVGRLRGGPGFRSVLDDVDPLVQQPELLAARH